MKIKKKFNLDYLKKNFSYGLIVNSGNFFSLFFQIILIKNFSDLVISEFSAISSFVSIILSLFILLPISISRFFISNELNDEVKTIVFSTLIRLMLFVIILFLILSYPISHYLSVDISLIFFSLPIILFTISSAYPLGIINSLSRYNLFGSLQILPLIFRLVFLIFLLSLNLTNNTNILIISISISVFLSFLIHSFFIQRKYYKFNYPLNLKKYKSNFLREILSLSFAAIITQLMLNFDYLVVKNIFSIEDSANYVSVVTFAKIPFYLLSILIFILFPESLKNNKNSHSLFIQTVLFALFSIFIFFTCIMIFGDYVLGFIIENYLLNKKFFLVSIISFSILTLVTFQIAYFINKKKYEFILNFVINSVLLFFAIYNLNLNEIFDFAIMLLVYFTTIFIFNFFFIIKEKS